MHQNLNTYPEWVKHTVLSKRVESVWNQWLLKCCHVGVRRYSLATEIVRIKLCLWEWAERVRLLPCLSSCVQCGTQAPEHRHAYEYLISDSAGSSNCKSIWILQFKLVMRTSVTMNLHKSTNLCLEATNLTTLL